MVSQFAPADEHLWDTDSSLSPQIHEYPDPDAAAYASDYPWLTDTEAYAARPWQTSFGPVHEVRSNGSQAASEDKPVFDNAAKADAGHLDTDYIDPDAIDSGDDNMSDASLDGDSDDYAIEQPSADLPHKLYSLSLGGLDQRPDSGNSGRGSRNNWGERASRVRGGGKRGGRRGLRRPLEPSLEFKALFSEATIAFTHSDHDKAEVFTLRALQINPEMFEAHNLLSQIHTAHGDKEKALSAAWNGAHLRPRDGAMWMKVANLVLERESNDRQAVLRAAIYCYNRVVNLTTFSMEARFRRAALNRELGHRRKSIADYQKLLESLPFDMTVLRNLAETYMELNSADAALQHYESTLQRMHDEQIAISGVFSWSDINIIAELYIILRRYEEGISQLKYLSRWLLGRKHESCWQTFDEDDREWDMNNEPRRIMTLGFVPGEFDLSQYGDGIPLELRMKFGLLRLFLDGPNCGEAMKHFGWLDTAAVGPGATLFDYPDLFREVAHALRSKGHAEKALRFYEPLQLVDEHVDATLFMDTALCYRSLGQKAAAQECYDIILESDPSFTEAQVALWNMARESEELSGQMQKHTVPVQRRELRKGPSTSIAGKSTSLPLLIRKPVSTVEKALPASLFATHQAATQPSEKQAEVQALYARWRIPQREFTASVEDLKTWLGASKLLLQSFLDEKAFFPTDRHGRFYGYSKEARALANQRKHAQDCLTRKSDSVLVTAEGDEITIPDEYLGISFVDWLDVFLESSLEHAKMGNTDAAYENIKQAFRANVFYHSSRASLLIHVCWFTCALLNSDEETSCNVARWFMTHYQFVSDGYRLFSALNRLSHSRHRRFNCGPSQKYILRQLKAMDFSLMSNRTKRSHFQERASFTTKDATGKPIQAPDLDVTLLMLYGFVLYAGRSYAYAVNYFLRALAIDPTNAVTKLALGLAYVHWAFKRQADNRHHIITQGFAFIMEYYESRRLAKDCSQKQEAEFNLARAYELVGLTHLAISHYEKCLQLSSLGHSDNANEYVEDFSQEAALALQLHWAANGDWERAQEVTKTWLVM